MTLIAWLLAGALITLGVAYILAWIGLIRLAQKRR